MPVGLPERLAQVDCWLFDMDNTLYPASSSLFPQIDLRMQAFVGRLLGLDASAARVVQKRYFHEYGTTLRGLMVHHGVDPQAFLDDVHDVDVSALEPNARLGELITRLPGRKIVFTNADRPYAERVLARIGVADCFDAIHDIQATQYWPKPNALAYESACRDLAIDPARAFFVDDMAHNLHPAKALGMVTAWVDNGSERGAHGYARDFIDFEMPELTDWLGGLLP
jgi:putative hydrolase of the HAD superfamily